MKFDITKCWYVFHHKYRNLEQLTCPWLWFIGQTKWYYIQSKCMIYKYRYVLTSAFFLHFLLSSFNTIWTVLKAYYYHQIFSFHCFIFFSLFHLTKIISVNDDYNDSSRYKTVVYIIFVNFFSMNWKKCVRK